jgi:hypothetical protein
MRISKTILAAGLLVLGYANVSTAQDVTIHEVTWTFGSPCDPGLGYGVDIFVDARGPSPGDIIISGTVEGCTPDLGPFQNSSTACNNATLFTGTVTAEDREGTSMDMVEFTIEPCTDGSQTYDGTGGTGGGGGGSAGTGGMAGTGGSGTGGVGGIPTDDAGQGGCDCTVQGSRLDYTKVGLSLLLVGLLAARRLRKRRR